MGCPAGPLESMSKPPRTVDSSFMEAKKTCDNEVCSHATILVSSFRSVLDHPWHAKAKLHPVVDLYKGLEISVMLSHDNANLTNNSTKFYLSKAIARRIPTFWKGH